MPDYDKIHNNLAGPYQKAYKKLCDGMALDNVSNDLLDALKKTLKYCGDAPILIIMQIAEHLKQVSIGPMFTDTVDWELESKNIDNLVRNVIHGNNRGLEIAKRICKRQLVLR